jgi:succinate dehydrogenase / fumarate reductase, flavoprotein subunit
MKSDFQTRVANILVIGTGAAGLRAAIAAVHAGLDVLVVGKRPRLDAHTVLAAGGINAVLATVDPQDSWEQHFVDTYKEAYYLANPRKVEILVRESPAAIQELADWGCRFNRTPDGQIDQRYFGAHKYRRTCYAGDFTGKEMLETLDRKASSLGLEVLEEKYVSRLLVHEGQCFGAFAFDLKTGQRNVLLADAVILAAGGHTRLWRRSSSRRGENTGDAMSLALQAGCTLADMEMVQFHPSGMTHPEEWAGRLVTEAVRGEGGRLLNSEGERFMQRYDPKRMELSTRDRVALAIYTEIIEGRAGPHGGVFLDISHRGRDYIREKLPRIQRQFLEAQMLDISQEKMEVAPTAHYSMGGVVIDPETCATGINGLYAVGEITSGLHGANRLGGNSLSETVVFGRRAGEAAAGFSRSLPAQPRSWQTIQAASQELDDLLHPGGELPLLVLRRLRDLMWEYCGVVRSDERLQQGLERLEDIRRQAADLEVQAGPEGYHDLGIALDLTGAIPAAEATLRSALARKESRGAHQRYDFPDLDPALRLSFRARLDASGTLSVEPHPLPDVPAELAAHLEDVEDYGVEGRLVE